MKKLTPEQASAIWNAIFEVFDKQPHPTEVGFRLKEVMLGTYEAIDKFTAKAGDKEWCKGCEWWRYKVEDWVGTLGCQGQIYRTGAKPSCQHPDFDGDNCPIGRWEEK